MSDAFADATALRDGQSVTFDLGTATIEAPETNWWDPTDGSLWFRLQVPSAFDDSLWIMVLYDDPDSIEGWYPVDFSSPAEGVLYLQLGLSGSYAYLNLLRTADGSAAASITDLIPYRTFITLPVMAGTFRAGFPTWSSEQPWTDGDIDHDVFSGLQLFTASQKPSGSPISTSSGAGHIGTANQSIGGGLSDFAQVYAYRTDETAYPPADPPIPPGTLATQWAAPGTVHLDETWLLSDSPTLDAPVRPYNVGAYSHSGGFVMHLVDEAWAPRIADSPTPATVSAVWDYGLSNVHTYSSLNGFEGEVATALGDPWSSDRWLFLGSWGLNRLESIGETSDSWFEGVDWSTGSLSDSAPPPVFCKLTPGPWRALLWPRQITPPLRMRQRDDGPRRYGRGGPSSMQATPRRYGSGTYA